jgi:signal transduction histidine kinase/DNA-binding response OmpR family regulator/methyl-accepting chemotaxis protein
MKLSLRILIINFAIVAIILGSAAFAFYSVMYNVLTSQQSKHLQNSSNDFLYTYRELLQDSQDDFYKIESTGENFFSSPDVLTNKLDFIFEIKAGKKNVDRWVGKKDIVFPQKPFNLKMFLADNPFVALKVTRTVEGNSFYYGRFLSKALLNDISSKINADVALIWDDIPVEVSNSENNSKNFHLLKKAYSELSAKNNPSVYSSDNESTCFVASIFTPAGMTENDNINFMVFSTINEAADLRVSIRYLIIIIGVVGAILSLILTLVFTDKIRKQITQLNKATLSTKEGDFSTRIEVKSKDEIGQLAGAFNIMMDELNKNQRAKNEYSEFITLLNQNPSLSEISDAALKKIIDTCRFTVGALYTVGKDEVNLVSSYGLKKDSLDASPALFSPVLTDHMPLEIESGESLPVVDTGLLSLSLKYILLQPVIYNNKVIAILELGSIERPSKEAKDYLLKIQEQLAIGLTNALVFVQMEKLIAELKLLNENYQEQNLQIKNQNDTLTRLHYELKQKAGELEQEKQKAEELTRLKSQFLASMSHELRTPMNAILGLTELILDDQSIKVKDRERLVVVLNSSKRLMNLINDILDLSKIEAGKMDVVPEDFLLEDLLKEVNASVTPLLVNKNIHFKVVKKTDTQKIINTDRGKTIQVLINLLGNAVKFTNEGTIELQVSETNSKQLKFDVIDSGIGISEEDQKIIFEEFRQIDGTTTRKYGGTGLGLTICKKIAELMNGSLSVRSEMGKGSTFTFLIPLIIVEQKKEGTIPRLNVEKLIKNRKHPILVIDDDPDVRYTIGQYLISKGYEVEYAEDGEKGLEKAIALQPFIITLDIMLPKKDGWNVLKKLKENPETMDIPVILVSIISDKNLGYGLGAYEYIVKPISSEKLTHAFTKLEEAARKRIEKIVVVDDDETVFENFRSEFINEDVRIDYIKDSELAFSKIKETQPDLIILDLLMPNVDGITLSHKLKTHRETRDIPIIISTNDEISENEKNALNNIVENITVKSKGHPLDVLKVVRDRIKLQENFELSTPTELSEGLAFPPMESVRFEEKSVKQENIRGEVLIVDDDPDTLFTLNEIVSSCNCNTVMVKSGRECLKILETRIPELILLDIMMPDMDGFQTLKRIRQNKAWRNIPVFAVTAKAMVEDKEIILKHGFDDYISKPVNSASMAFKIERLFSQLNSVVK